MAAPTRTAVSPIRAALGCRCPRCGQGSLFRGFLTVVDRCAVCDLKLADNDSGDGPAVFLIFILGALAVPVALWIEFTFRPPVWVHALTTGGLVLGLTALTLRPAKAYVVALQYRHNRHDFET